VAEAEKLDGLRAEVGSATSALALATRAAGLQRRTGTAPHDEKSLIASGALSFFFGPLGWLYAAPLREAIPAIFIFLIVGKFLPLFLMSPLFLISALAGVAYAWRYNQTGERTPLVGDVKRALPPSQR
jgi:hypothetical protein